MPGRNDISPVKYQHLVYIGSTTVVNLVKIYIHIDIVHKSKNKRVKYITVSPTAINSSLLF